MSTCESRAHTEIPLSSALKSCVRNSNLPLKKQNGGLLSWILNILKFSLKLFEGLDYFKENVKKNVVSALVKIYFTLLL